MILTSISKQISNCLFLIFNTVLIYFFFLFEVRALDPLELKKSKRNFIMYLKHKIHLQIWLQFDVVHSLTSSLVIWSSSLICFILDFLFCDHWNARRPELQGDMFYRIHYRHDPKSNIKTIPKIRVQWKCISLLSPNLLIVPFFFPKNPPFEVGFFA